MQALLLSGGQLLSPHLSPSSSKGDAGGQGEGGQEKTLLSFSFSCFFLQVPVPSCAKAALVLLCWQRSPPFPVLSCPQDAGCTQQGGCGRSPAPSAPSA